MGLLERHPNPSVPGIRLSRLGVQFVELPFFQEPLSSPNLGRQGRPPSEFA
jgi:hypothetical protein